MAFDNNRPPPLFRRVNPRELRRTRYDMMESAGFFADNPANPGATALDGSNLYKGPVEYPKMLYHPTGEQRIVVAERLEPTPTGPVKIPPIKEMISQVVNSREEEEALRAEGWHDHPAKALAQNPEFLASGLPVPPMSSNHRIRDLEVELERLQGQLQAQQGLSPKARTQVASAT